ncbi:retron Ec67 family RNA-directed DNA polymerase/endonuclease [Vibrio aestuarianus]|uniref:retron Ec67 family RNA-directed DNA polymerase/endonuclease n=1 Tax=Vibrio aestuarianus TaxID=28171 RepID=UPI003BAFF585
MSIRLCSNAVCTAFNINIDLDNFFGSFNFGRVRGFFIKNKNFELHVDVATAIAQIACFKDELPQGSPCSPVITNLICHPMDIVLARMAKKYSCTYTRYADDITFSTRKNHFPSAIMVETNGVYTPSKKLDHEICRAGFVINHKKSRIQYQDSRQDVTGLIVNKKIGIKKEYRRITKAMCHSLFCTGQYVKVVEGEETEGTINELEGRLNFIDSIDRHNRVNYPESLSPLYQHRKHGVRTREVWNSREKTFSRFLYYKYFYANQMPTVLCEGHTDNIYLKSALKSLKVQFPKLIDATNFKITFVNYSKRTRFLLELAGGTSYLANFITSFEERYKFYQAPKPENPVIIILDNDDGLEKNGGILVKLQEIQSTNIFPPPPRKGNKKNKLKNADFIHVTDNLYVVFTPLKGGRDTMIEDLFDVAALSSVVSGRTFDRTEKLKPSSSYYGKNEFATQVIQKQASTINFSGFTTLLSRVVKAIEHYESIR